MSTPIVGGIYAHPGIFAPVLYRVVSASPQAIVVRPVLGRRRPLLEVTPNHFAAGCFTLVDSGAEDDDLLAVAEAVGVVVEVDGDEPIPYRVAGEQPPVEFSEGPVGPGALWSDAHLASVFFGGESA